MIHIAQEILRWSEVWALLIPLTALALAKDHPLYLKPVKYYIFIALLLNVVANLISYQKTIGIVLPLHNNIFFYNLHSVLRLLLFSWFFWQLHQFTLYKKRAGAFFSLLSFVFIGLTLHEFFSATLISSYSYAVEAGILLLYCLYYYLRLLQEEQISFAKLPSFWVTTGLSIFVIISFPIYLFYKFAAIENTPLAINIWKVQKISYVIFCVFVAKAFYESKH